MAKHSRRLGRLVASGNFLTSLFAYLSFGQPVLIWQRRSRKSNHLAMAEMAIRAICEQLEPRLLFSSVLLQANSSQMAGAGPIASVVADFNGDGILDVAVANSSDNSISIYLGEGNGILSTPVSMSAPYEPNYLAVADLNHDGKADLVVSNWGSNTVGVLLGFGDGTFESEVTYSLLNLPHRGGSAAVAIADINGDNVPDIVSADNDGTLSLLTGNGDGTFNVASTITIGGNLEGVWTGDFNGDGKPDIVTTNYGNGDVDVLLNQGNGAFSTPITYATGGLPEGVVAGDFNGDGKPDLAVTDAGNGTVDIFVGNGDGTFQTPTDYSVGGWPMFLATTDLNGDGKLDLVVPNYTSNTISVLPGNGDGTFGTAQSYDTDGGPTFVTIGDLNGDGKPDVIVDSYGFDELDVLLNSSSYINLEPAVSYSSGGYPTLSAVGDFNGDGHLDVAVSNYADGTIGVYLGNGDGTLGAPTIITDSGDPDDVVTGDLNGDGKEDLVVADVATGRVGIFLGNGDGTFQAEQYYSTSLDVEFVAIADVNGDGIPDIISENPDGVTLLLGNGNGTFTVGSTINVGAGLFGIWAGDLNGDGKTDIVVADDSTSGVAYVLIGEGNGTFASPVAYLTSDIGTTGIAVGDFTGDGKLDLVVSNRGGDTIDLFPGNGNGTFQSPIAYDVGDNPSFIAAADINGDGLLDLVIPNYTLGIVTVLPGAVGGGFDTAQTYSAGYGSGSVSIGDFNGDGKPDIFVANWDSYAVNVLLNGQVGPTSLGPPTNLIATATNKSTVSLTWQDNATAETGFAIEQSTDGTHFTQIGTTTANIDNYIINYTSSDPSGTYYYRIRAFNSLSDSAYSGTATATVGQLLTSIVATPATLAPAANGTQQFSAVAYDQFGDPMETQPTFTWSVSGTGYTISSGGLLTAPATIGTYTVQATGGGIASSLLSFSSKILVTTAAAAIVDSVTHTTASLTVAAADPDGGGDLTYTWMTTNDAPSAVGFADNGDNTANQTTAYFSAAGTYHFLVMITAQDGTSTSSSVTVTVDQTLSAIAVTSSQSAPGVEGTQQFAADGYDQFGNPMVTAPTFTWSVTGSGYSISSTGLVTAGSTLGTYSVTAGSGDITSAPVSYSSAVTIVDPAASTLDSSGTYAELTALGTDSAGGSDLTYTWTVTSGNASDVSFFDNGDNSSSDTFAFFTSAGIYHFTVTASAPGEDAQTSTVTVDVAQLLTTISTMPLDELPFALGTQHFSATAYDQFGYPLGSQPRFTWTVDNPNDSITGDGTLTAGATPWDYSVVASVGGISSTPLTFSQTVTVATAPTAILDSSSHTTATLDVLGADPDGESTLTYTWTTIGSPPAAVTFSDNWTNSAKETTATFAAAGVYQFQVTITDENGLSMTADVTFAVAQTLSGIYVATSDPMPEALGTQQFSAIAYDQFGYAMATQPAVTWAVTGSGYSVSSSGLVTAGSTTGSYSVTASSGSITSTPLSYSQSLTLVTSASATLDSTSTYATLQTLGTDASGGSDLTYTWTLTSGDASAVSFYDNASTTASDTFAFFTAAGEYTLLATIADPGGDTTTSSVTVDVVQVFSGISITTDQGTAGAYGTQQFSGVAYDQFGNALNTQPTLAWSVTGAGYTISSGGLVTGGSTAEDYSVSATSGIFSSNTLSFSQAISNSAYGSVDYTGTTAALSASASDSSGDTDLTYVWTTTANSPAGVSFSDNASDTANNVTASFSQAGTYTFIVEVVDSDGLETTSSVTLTVDQNLTSISLTPVTASPAADGTQQFSAVAYDQFGIPMATPPTFYWSVTGSGYSISSSGLLTAGSTVGPYMVTVYGGSASSSLSFGQDLAVQTAASASLDSSGTFATLTVLGADAWGGADLTYTWTLTSGNDDDVDFSDNYSNTASNTTAYFYAEGTYDFLVTISDDTGASVTSAVSVTVGSVVSSIDVTSADPVPLAGGTQQFVATAYDQFGNIFATQPDFDWSVSGDGYTIDGSGLMTAGSIPGAYIVTASSGGVSDSPSPDNFAPVIVTAANSTLSGDETSTTLSVQATDMSGIADLTYSWDINDDAPGYADFSDNDSKSASSVVATFDTAGTYDFTVTITNDVGMSVSSEVSVTVSPNLTSIVVTTNDPVVEPSATAQFTAKADDQFGNPLATQPTFTWAIEGDGNSIDDSGNATAGTDPGSYAVTATSGDVSGSASLGVKGVALNPHLQNQTVNTDAGVAVGINLYTGDTNGDAADDPYVPYYTGVTQQPAHGTFAMSGGSYQPDPGFSGTDTFQISTYNNDWIGGIETITVIVAPPPPPTPPTPPDPPVPYTPPTFTPTNNIGDTVTLSTNANISLTGSATWDIGGDYELSVSYNPGNGNNSVSVTFDGSTVTISGGSQNESVGYDLVTVVADIHCDTPLSVTWDGGSSATILSVTADTLTDVTSSGQVSLNSSNLTGSVNATDVDGSVSDLLSGSVNASGNITYFSVGDLTGSLTAGGVLGGSYPMSIGYSPDGNYYDLSGTIQASGDVNIEPYGNVTSAASITSTSGSLVLRGQSNVDGTLSAAAGTSEIYSNGNITASIHDSSGSLQVIGDTGVSATFTVGDLSSLDIHSSQDISGDIDVATESLLLQTSGIVSANVTYSGGTLNVSGDQGITGSITQTSGIMDSIASNYGDITGAITTSGSIYGIGAGGTISGNITASSGISGISAGVDLTGLVTCTSGNITMLTVGRDMTGGMAGTGDTVGQLIVGRDLTTNEIDAGTIGDVTVGRDLSAAVHALQNITQVSVGRVISGNITSDGGSITSVSAGDSPYGGPWPDTVTANGSMSSITISAGTSVGEVSVLAALGYTGLMSNVTITAHDGDIGSVTAVSGISGNITASGSIDAITTSTGDIAGILTATTGNIPAITLTNGNLHAILTAGGNIGDLTIANDITGNITAGGNIGDITVSNGTITGNITSSNGSIGDVTTLNDITYNITAAGSIGNVTSQQGNISSNVTSTGGNVGDIYVGETFTGNINASINIGWVTVGDTNGGNLTGNLTATMGTIGDITITGDGSAEDGLGNLSGQVTAGQSIGDITILGEISGNSTITAGSTIGTIWILGSSNGAMHIGSGNVSITSWGNVTGAISAVGNVVVFANGDITGGISSTAGGIDGFASGKIANGSVAARFNVVLLAGYDITSAVNSSQGAVQSEAWNLADGNVTETGDGTIWSGNDNPSDAQPGAVDAFDLVLASAENGTNQLANAMTMAVSLSDSDYGKFDRESSGEDADPVVLSEEITSTKTDPASVLKKLTAMGQLVNHLDGIANDIGTGVGQAEQAQLVADALQVKINETLRVNNVSLAKVLDKMLQTAAKAGLNIPDVKIDGESTLSDKLKENIPGGLMIEKPVEEKIKTTIQQAVYGSDEVTKGLLEKVDKGYEFLDKIQVGAEVEELVADSNNNPGNLVIALSKILDKANDFNKVPGANDLINFYAKATEAIGKAMNDITMNLSKENIQAIMEANFTDLDPQVPFSVAWAAKTIGSANPADLPPGAADLLKKMKSEGDI